MKRFLFIGILFVLCLTSFQAHAQRYLPGMKGLQVTAGMADGVHWNDNTDFAYHIGAAYSVYTKNANRWVIGGEYLHKKYDYKDMRIPVEQFTAEGGYYLK
ncbi:conjugal transfer protein, partial [Parabacteroides distasonis]